MLPNAIIRNSSWDNGYIQVKTALGTYYQGVIASDFKVSSKETYKTNIRPITSSLLEKVMEWEIKQYNLKTDIPKLYEMRMNRKRRRTDNYYRCNPYALWLSYSKRSKGKWCRFIWNAFATNKRFPRICDKTDARIEELEPIKPKGNIKHRNKVKRQRRPPRRVKRNR